MKRYFVVCALVFAALLLVSAPQVRADGFDSFTFMRPDPSTGNVNTYTWTLASTLTLPNLSSNPGACGVADLQALPPIPGGSNCGVVGSSFAVDAFVSQNGAPALLDSLLFYNISSFGGFADFGNNAFGFNFLSNQVYSGNETNPTFVQGTYVDSFGGTDTLTITAVPVPEPGAFLLLVTGMLALIGVVSLKKLTV